VRPLTVSPGVRGGKFLKFWFPVILYSGIIFCVSAVPYMRPPLETGNIDKAIHILEYLLFGFLLARAFQQQWPAIGIGRVVTLCALLYGISDEYHQSFVPGRDADVSDVIADTIGGFLGAWIYQFRHKRVKTRQKIG
jgi:VanZ family protein